MGIAMVRSVVLGALLGVLSLVAAADSGSAYLRVPLGKGASIEVPKNWIVLSGNHRQTLAAAVEARVGNLTPVDLVFAANLYDDAGKAIAVMNVRFYPDNPFTQAQARELGGANLSEFDKQLHKAAEAPLPLAGAKMTKWYGTQLRDVGPLAIIVHEHEQSMPDGGAVRVRGNRVLNSPRSFTVTISYRVAREALLRPIVDYMAGSIRQQ